LNLINLLEVLGHSGLLLLFHEQPVFSFACTTNDDDRTPVALMQKDCCYLLSLHAK